MRKEMDKKAYQTFSRKLFSIYRYKISNLRPIKNNSISEEVNQDQQQELAGKEQKHGTKFSSCIHYYKRDLSPIRETFPQCSIKTPYRQNFSNYELNMMSKDFKSSLLKSMGGNVKCIQSTDQNRRIATYYNENEASTQKHIGKRFNLDNFLPANNNQVLKA